jgi:hypothetical protein
MLTDPAGQYHFLRTKNGPRRTQGYREDGRHSCRLSGKAGNEYILSQELKRNRQMGKNFLGKWCEQRWNQDRGAQGDKKEESQLISGVKSTGNVHFHLALRHTLLNQIHSLRGGQTMALRQNLPHCLFA